MRAKAKKRAAGPDPVGSATFGSERCPPRRKNGGPGPDLVGTRGAFGEPMDRIFFGLKRAFHSSLRVARRDFKELGLTAARMDLLYALKRAGRKKRTVWQSQLRRILGYTARSTLTEMLRALEALGWTRRKRSLRDGRQLEVELTQAGRAQLKEAEYHFLPGWWGIQAPDVAKDWSPPSPAEDDAWEAYLRKGEAAYRTLAKFRFALRDTGSLLYPWPHD